VKLLKKNLAYSAIIIVAAILVVIWIAIEMIEAWNAPKIEAERQQNLAKAFEQCTVDFIKNTNPLNPSFGIAEKEVCDRRALDTYGNNKMWSIMKKSSK